MMVREGLNCSRKFRITARVPQGGISSLSLFKFYLSDIPIPKYTKESGSVFADDCVSWAFGYNAQQAAESVQFFLNGFEAWCKSQKTRKSPVQFLPMIALVGPLAIMLSKQLNLFSSSSMASKVGAKPGEQYQNLPRATLSFSPGTRI